ncbi:hypothetical protein BGX27_006600 [Mortierella sp. AM989]|nr:hypothetical protein BGX27_006600 [Mortierella sp. AM989]
MSQSQKRFVRTSSVLIPNGKTWPSEMSLDTQRIQIPDHCPIPQEPQCTQDPPFGFQYFSSEAPNLFSDFSELQLPGLFANPDIVPSSLDLQSTTIASFPLDPSNFMYYGSYTSDVTNSLSPNASSCHSPPTSCSSPDSSTLSPSPNPYDEMGRQSYSVHSDQEAAFILFAAEMVSDDITSIKPKPRTRRVKIPRSHQCDYPGCSKKFDRRYNLQQHSKTHCKDAKRHACSECDKTFIRPADLQRHHRIHSGDKPFNCQWCCQKFRRTESRQRHCRKDHPEEYNELFL